MVICADAPTGDASLYALAERTGFPIASAETHDSSDYQLYYASGNALTLRDNTVSPPISVSIDFCAGGIRHRQHFGGGLGQPIARAVNAKKLQHTDQVICDATGGFGRDAWVFASLGCQVVLLERSLIVYELLRDAIARAQSEKSVAAIAMRMQVCLADSTKLPTGWPHHKPPHTIYLDPMYPQMSSKSAAAKKEMQTLKRLLKTDLQNRESNDSQLLHAALKTATKRVVVKRPKNAEPIHGQIPVGDIRSANTRYDIYQPQPAR